jgi:2-polyprenyl-3-methyl-5-hydroxy-6-metoxy-1,4-benzoquinol methylase
MCECKCVFGVCACLHIMQHLNNTVEPVYFGHHLVKNFCLFLTGVYFNEIEYHTLLLIWTEFVAGWLHYGSDHYRQVLLYNICNGLGTDIYDSFLSIL